MTTVLHSHDVDVDELSASLRTIADGIESRELPVTSVSAETAVEDDKDVSATISLGYLLAEGYEHTHEFSYKMGDG